MRLSARRFRRVVPAAAAVWAVQAVAAGSAASSGRLAGTQWRFVEFQAMDDRAYRRYELAN
jgi:hypothetical protein